MQVDGKGNFLSRFIGLLHVPDQASQLNIDYDPDNAPGQIDVEESHRPHAANAPVDLDDVDRARSPAPPDLPSDPWDPTGHVHTVLVPSIASPHAVGVPPPHLPPPTTQQGGGGGGDAELRIDVTYQSGGDQDDVRVVQLNVLRSDDTITSDGSPPAWPDHHAPDFQFVQHTAAEAMPDAYAHTDLTSPESIIATLTDLGAHSSGHGPQTLQEGMVIDGKSVDPNLPLPTDPTTLIPTMPTDHHANMAVVESGGNLSTNFGGIANDNGQDGTLLVLGDSYKSNAIVQTNVLVDQSFITGTTENASIHTGGDAASNVAQFVQTLDQNPYTMGFFGGLHWHVDTVQGDFYDIKLATQYNYMTDNDLVQQNATDHYKFVETGGNEQGNELVAYNLNSEHYDLIVVTGNSYSANWIFQTNVLLNSNYVSVDAGPGGAGQETVVTGNNWTSNEAQITDFSGPGHALTPEMKAVADALANHDTSLDGNAGLAIPGNGSDTLNVLFINGNYYDLNVLQQTNVVNNTDTVQQTLSNGESGYVMAGGNSLTNQAIIIDVGSTGGQYVGGQQYSDSVLVQTNIIAQSSTVQSSGQTGGPITTNDPSHLAPEAAAIIQHDAPSQPAPDPTPVPPAHETVTHSTDPLSSVLA